MFKLIHNETKANEAVPRSKDINPVFCSTQENLMNTGKSYHAGFSQNITWDGGLNFIKGKFDFRGLRYIWTTTAK